MSIDPNHPLALYKTRWENTPADGDDEVTLTLQLSGAGSRPQADLDRVCNHFQSRQVNAEPKADAPDAVGLKGPRKHIMSAVIDALDEGSLSRLIVGVGDHHPSTAAGGGVYTFEGLRKRYEFPKHGFGKGETIAVTVLGGGYYPEDLEAFWRMLGRPQFPNIAYYGKNDPCPRDDLDQWLSYWKLYVKGNAYPPPIGEIPHWTYEIAMNLAIISAMAPEADLCVFNLDPTDPNVIQHLEQYISQAKPTVISGSWALAETADPNVVHAVNHILERFSESGGTAVFACGNTGSNLNTGSNTHIGSILSGDKAEVNFPASSPHVIGVGAERIEDADADTRVDKLWETNLGGNQDMAGGGGVSAFFNEDPPWQTPYKRAYQQRHGYDLPPGRALPDLCMMAAEDIGPHVVCNGEVTISGGTSLATQLTASLILCIRGELTRLGCSTRHLNRKIYHPAVAITFKAPTHSGNNWIPSPRIKKGPYDYHPEDEWSPCLGLGSPRGRDLLAALIDLDKQSRSEEV